MADKNDVIGSSQEVGGASTAPSDVKKKPGRPKGAINKNVIKSIMKKTKRKNEMPRKVMLHPAVSFHLNSTFCAYCHVPGKWGLQ